MTSRRRPRSIGTGERSETARAGRSGMPSVRQTPSSVQRSLGNWLAESVEHACMDRRNRRRFRCDHDIRQARMRIPTAHSPPTKFNDRSIQVCLFPIRAGCPMLAGVRSVRARATRREARIRFTVSRSILLQGELWIGPLGHPMGRRRLRWSLGLPVVLIPGSLPRIARGEAGSRVRSTRRAAAM